jgi:hypothetical protein
MFSQAALLKRPRFLREVSAGGPISDRPSHLCKLLNGYPFFPYRFGGIVCIFPYRDIWEVRGHPGNEPMVPSGLKNSHFPQKRRLFKNSRVHFTLREQQNCTTWELRAGLVIPGPGAGQCPFVAQLA